MMIANFLTSPWTTPRLYLTWIQEATAFMEMLVVLLVVAGIFGCIFGRRRRRL
jgi:hypothetical protein